MSETTTHPPIKRLTCCCCGGSTIGRQWHNRALGFGFCQDCHARLKQKGYADEEMHRLYGKAGYHYPDENGEVQL